MLGTLYVTLANYELGRRSSEFLHRHASEHWKQRNIVYWALKWIKACVNAASIGQNGPISEFEWAKSWK